MVFSLRSFWAVKKSISVPNFPGFRWMAKGIDREIPPKKVQFKGAHLHGGKGGRKLVILHSGGSDIDFKSIRENYDRRTEFGMRVNARLHVMGIIAGQRRCRRPR